MSASELVPKTALTESLKINESAETSQTKSLPASAPLSNVTSPVNVAVDPAKLVAVTVPLEGL